MSKEIVKTKKAPPAIGPYSQGVIITSSKLVFTAGQIPMDPETGQIVSGGIEDQTIQVLNNIRAILKAAGSDTDHVVKTIVFLKDMNDFSKMNRIYETVFKHNPPARSAIEAARLPKDVLIEMECIAEVIP